MNDKQKYKIFVDACKYWIDKFNLNHIEFNFVIVDDAPDRIAAATYQYDAHNAYIELSSEVNDRDEIIKAALHEVLEVLLMPMKLQAINLADAFHPYVQHETHAVIHILESILEPT